MTRTSIALAAAMACCGGALIVAQSHGGAKGGPFPDPPMSGIHWARGQQPAARPSSTPNLLYHGGPVLHGTTVEPIFWGAKWTNSTFAGDKINGLQTFYGGMGSSSYANTNTEYTDGSGHVSAAAS